jgi:hypothetical protein
MAPVTRYARSGEASIVIHRSGDSAWDPRHSRYLAEHIPGARHIELDGIDSLPFVGDSDAIVEEIEEFLTGGRSALCTRTTSTTYTKVYRFL